ncbi:MAG: glycosyltransferase family 4 protein [Blastocatellia bacterium]|nr:glycosyltransferase family 4 protein [Blastocatellia bacterium]
MKILQMGPYPPPHGGVQTNIVAIRRFLLERRIPCSVINLTRHRRADAEEVYYPKNALEVLRLLVRLPVDIIHLHIGGDISLRLLALGLICCLLPRRKTVLTFHSGGYPLSEAGKRARPATLRGFIFRRFDRIIGVNLELEELFKKFGVPSRRVRLIHPHALTSEPPCAPLPPRLEKFFESHSPVLTTVGLLEPEYDLPLQIEALALVRERFPNAGLLIAGSGSLEEELRELIDSKPHGEHILLCGDLEHTATLRAIAESDLFLRTTLYDGDSISVREALHLGVTVIATDNRMRPDGVCLIPPSDLGALCEAIEQNLFQSKPRQTDGEADEKNLQEVLKLYRELMEGTEA